MRAQLSLALAVGLALTIAGASAKPVELSSSVILFYSSELYVRNRARQQSATAPTAPALTQLV
jgi:hypothetical protein